MNIDRSEINKALAKAIAYKQCNKQTQAQQWARKLINLLECADILAPEDDYIIQTEESWTTEGGAEMRQKELQTIYPLVTIVKERNYWKVRSFILN